MTAINEPHTRLAEISNELEQLPNTDVNPMILKAREGTLIANGALLMVMQRGMDPEHEEIDSFNGAWRSVWHEKTW